jgi:hypothetical protein
MVKLKFCRAWRVYRSGQVVDVPGGLAADLVARKVAVHDSQAELIETAAVENDAETADARPRKRGRRAIQQPNSTDRPDR